MKNPSESPLIKKPRKDASLHHLFLQRTLKNDLHKSHLIVLGKNSKIKTNQYSLRTGHKINNLVIGKYERDASL